MKSFLIPSLIAAGFTTNGEDTSVERNNTTNFVDDYEVEESILNLQLPFILAGHRSHSSHSSHSSHRSSSGGSIYVPKSYTAPRNNSTSPGTILPKIKPNTQEYSALLLEMQTCLNVFNYYTGPLDGMLNSKTVQAISKAQKQNDMPVTGKLDMEFIKRCRYSLK